MPLSWNEIRHRAIQVAHNWAGTRSEAAEKQTFWNEFFEVFGIQRRLVASFEEPVKRISGQYGYIDLFWKSTLLVEHKSFGQDLGKAQSRAFQYLQDLLNEGRAKEAPRYVIVSDFARIALHDLEPEQQEDLPLFAGRRVHTLEFPLAEFHKHIHAFAFIPGYKQHRFADQDPINLEATEIMGHSNKLVYNNHPWPQSPTTKQKEAVEAAAQKVLDVRAHFLAPVGQTSGQPVQGASGSQSQNAHAGSGSAATPPEEALTGRPEVCPTKRASLADLYDPLSMPPALVKAHTELGRAVDLCYRPQPFTSERQRVEYLFGLYERLTAPLLPAAAPKRPRKRVST